MLLNTPNQLTPFVFHVDAYQNNAAVAQRCNIPRAVNATLLRLGVIRIAICARLG